MARLLLLLVFAVWLLPPAEGLRPIVPATLGVWMYLGGHLLLVLVIALCARLVIRRVGTEALHDSLRRFGRVSQFGRWLIPVWQVYGIYLGLGWKHTVVSAIQPLLPMVHGDVVLYFPSFIVGTLPAMAAWVALWWAAYPADRALREQSLLDQLDRDLPIHRPPDLPRHMLANLRQQLLFILAPIGLVLIGHDLLVVVLRLGRVTAAVEELMILPAAGLVYLFAPELLRRVLNARPLADSPLRRRLETICKRVGLRCRDILVWHTDFSMGNAAVMGLVPRWRYILLSDLLLESMTDRQIEAVFAHEVGHVVHHHMRWYFVFFAILAFAAAGPGTTLGEWVLRINSPGDTLWWEGRSATFPGLSHRQVFEIGSAAASLLVTLIAFGHLSRRFERQADVFAARMMQVNWGFPIDGESANHWRQALIDSHVGEEGAAVFSSSLYRVATINNIPTHHRDWFHGSIARRMRDLSTMSVDPQFTGHFDRIMVRLYVALGAVLLVLGLWTALQQGAIPC